MNVKASLKPITAEEFVIFPLSWFNTNTYHAPAKPVETDSNSIHISTCSCRQYKVQFQLKLAVFVQHTLKCMLLTQNGSFCTSHPITCMSWRQLHDLVLLIWIQTGASETDTLSPQSKLMTYYYWPNPKW